MAGSKIPVDEKERLSRPPDLRSFHISPIRWFHDRFLFGYFTPFMKRAKHGEQFRPETLPSLWENDNVDHWSRKFIDASRKEWERPSGPSEQALIRCLLRVFWPQFLAIFLISVSDVFLSSTIIKATRYFLVWVEKVGFRSSESLLGLFLSLCPLVLELLAFFVTSQLLFWKERIAIRVEGALGTALFKRMLMPATPDDKTVDPRSSAKVDPRSSPYNVLMLDVPSVARCINVFAELCVIPVTILMSFSALNDQFGAPAVITLCVISVIILVIIALEVYNGFLKKPLLHNRDRRIEKTHEMLSDIKGIRMVGWDDIAVQEIQEMREREIRVRKERMYIHGMTWSFSETLGSIVHMTVITSYVLIGLASRGDFVLKASIAIPVIQIIMKLVDPLSNTSLTAHALIESAVSIKRYQRHLFGSSNNVKSKLRRSKSSIAVLQDFESSPTALGDDSKRCVHANGAIFSWAMKRPSEDTPDHTPDHTRDDSEETHLIASPTPAPKFQLHVPKLEVNAGECVLIMGAPGSGKSSLLLALLGEMNRIRGQFWVRRSVRTENEKTQAAARKKMTTIAYASQVPWIPEGTVRAAILFGRPFDSERYRKAVAASELISDFESWIDGDQRMVLEGGQNLSGGQRTRIALARALYDFPVPETKPINRLVGTKAFLLDDPCGSADPRVGFLIFRKLFAKEGLLQHAASLMTIDEPSLKFYLRMMRVNGCTPSVDFKVIVMANGVAHEVPITKFEVGLPPLAPVMTPLDPVVVPGVKKNDVLAEADQSRSVEGSYTGVIGLATYGWYGKQVGWLFSVIILFGILALGLAGRASELWIPCWVYLSKAIPTPPVAQLLATISNSTSVGTDVPGHTRRLADMPLSPHAVEASELSTMMATQLANVDKALESDASSNASQTSGASEAPDTSATAASTTAAPTTTTKSYPRTLEPLWTESRSRYIMDPRLIRPYDLEDEKEDMKALIGRGVDAFSLDTLRKVADETEVSVDTAVETDKGLVDNSTDSTEHARVMRGDSDALQADAPQAGGLQAEALQAGNVTEVAEIPPVEDEAQAQASREKTKFYLLIFLAITFGSTLGSFLLVAFETHSSLVGCVRIHDSLLKSVVGAPFWVYDFISIGTILNRFSSDMQLIDVSPMYIICTAIDKCFKVLLVVSLICVFSPAVTPLIPVVMWAIYIFVYCLYKPTVREFQRAKLLAFSPLCGILGEAESGAIVIRAFGGQELYSQRNMQLTSNLLKAQFMQSGANSWADLRLQLIAFSVSVASYFAPYIIATFGLRSTVTVQATSFAQFAASAGYVGLAMNWALRLPKDCGKSAQCIAQTERSMCSIQRVREMVSIGENALEESKLCIKGEQILKVSDFPQKRTGVKLSKVSVAYQKILQVTTKKSDGDLFKREFLEPSLVRVTAHAKPGQHIGVVGRTGAGKSTLLLSLLNLVTPTSGSITLDGVPLANIGREAFTQLVGVLPQCPLVFKGWTARKFLDPYNLFTREQLMEVVEKVGMTKVINNLPNGLDSELLKDDLRGIKDMAPDDCRGVGTGDDCASKIVSDSQLRMLSLARLALSADKYRLVLVDEPPPRQVDMAMKQEKSKWLSSRGSLNSMDSQSRISSPGRKSDSSKSIYESEDTSEVECEVECEVADVIQSIFKHCTVIIVAHHASTVKNCDTIWIFSKGSLVGQVGGSQISSQESLMAAISAVDGSAVASRPVDLLA